MCRGFMYGEGCALGGLVCCVLSECYTQVGFELT